MSYDKTKTDPALGQKVHEYLVSVGVETPVIDNGLSRKEKIDKIEGHFDEIVGTLGLDLKDDSLMDTPKRVAKMYVNEIFWGLDYDAFPKATVVENKMNYNEMIVERNISVQSNCEHHFVVIDGLATVAYVPKKNVLGLSKINRIVEYFSKRPQIQERLTEQIYHALAFILDTENVAVMVDAQHYCVKSRGVEDTGSSTITSRLGGSFKAHPEVRAEFLSLLKV
ncbi:GTP cyclohydrolase I [SAR86 cluster bacterium SAR86E]|jgi:GTP cyclohydrolase I|uniref:GTP cyclohydrolase 1 n=1 Tax=SAR86 cluster bacterium SAR86E TaxID=1208365 RepID=K6H3V4_9GAMM|nr:GTP cyclohydrolase I [SAR86 cluster bacterium SAR86E]